MRSSKHSIENCPPAITFVMQKLIKELVHKNDSKIIFVVLDGLGGLPVNGIAELEALTRMLLRDSSVRGAHTGRHGHNALQRAGASRPLRI
jgi:hypothetical protein